MRAVPVLRFAARAAGVGRVGVLAGAGLLAALAALSCAHGSPIIDGVLEKGSVRLDVGPVPAGWNRVHLDGADLAFRDQSRDGSAMVDFRCHGPDDDAPLPVLTQQLIMGTTDRRVVGEEIIPFDGREAQHTVMRAKLDGVDLEYDIYVLKKDGCVFDYVYVAPPSVYGVGAAAFEKFARALHATTPPVKLPSERVGGAKGATSAGVDP